MFIRIIVHSQCSFNFIQFDFIGMNQDSRAQGRGRIARIHRRLLVIETEKRIMQYQSYIEQGRVRFPLSSFFTLF